MRACVRVFVCVCEKEREGGSERGRERAREGIRANMLNTYIGMEEEFFGGAGSNVNHTSLPLPLS